jgi:lipopolysaccharide/colanic/teichoic acid biosynthesis glycosyltransferase
MARVFDIVVAAAGLILFSPLVICIAAAIVIEDGRPIFFSHLRLGQRRRHFRMHKFRKFSAGRTNGPSLTLEDDPRLTRIGGFLARTKLDELPQLWNVLKGDMSIVGPRPESLAFQDCFKEPWGALLEHKPGIFGPSQALFRNEGSLYRGRPDTEQFYRDVLFPLKAHIDLTYFPQRTLLRDVAWILCGALAVFGWSSSRQGERLVEDAEDWIGESNAGSRGPSALRRLTRVRVWGAVEIVGDGENEISAVGGSLAAPRRQAVRQQWARAPTGGTAPRKWPVRTSE